MSVTKFAGAGAALAVIGLLGAWAADSASAAPARTRDCRGTYQAIQNGECTDTRFQNPSRVVENPCVTGGRCYRSGSQKHHKHHTS